MDFTPYIDAVLNNQVVTGLSFTALLGGAVYQLRSVPTRLWNLLLWWCTVEMNVTNEDAAFEWIERWVASQPYAKRTRRVRLRSFEKDGPRDWREEQSSAVWALSVGDGLHWFRWRRRLVWLHRHRPDRPAGSSPRGRQSETMHFRTIGTSQAVLRELVTEAYEAATKTATVAIWTWQDGYWEPVRGKAIRSLDTIVLAAGQTERLVADLQRFAQSREWYATRGLPYRRGYLFSGPPGTGKTSLVFALAGALNRPICALNLGSVSSDTALLSAITSAPSTAIILLEDIDCAQQSRVRDEKAKDDERLGVTKAGLLNALDGILTPDGRVFVMTTNRPETLDAALIRPGRADLLESFGFLAPDRQRLLASRFYAPNAFVPLAAPASPAALQAAFSRYPDDPAAARRLLLEDNRAAA